MSRTATRRTAGDAFGLALLDWQRGSNELEVLERDDGFSEPGAGPEFYLSEFAQWPACEKKAIRYAVGPAIDIGCGAGRVAVELQRRGVEVVAADASDCAVRAARASGVKETWCCRVEEMSARIGRFQTIILFGNNFGILADPDRLRAVLADWAGRTSAQTRILAESVSPHGAGAPGIDRQHRRENVARGRLPGSVRLRTVYGDVHSDWFDWLFVSPREMRALVKGTGWRQAHVIENGRSDSYVGVLEKT